MIIVLTGAPGAGKGTQADLLVKRDGYKTLSTGSALRKHIQAGTPIGKVAEGLVTKGHLVPDDVLLKILEEELKGTETEVVLLDGYPRNLNQAKDLETALVKHRVKGVVALEVPKDELIRRISGRLVCSKCGATYHETMNPPRVKGVCDNCGALGLARRADDAPDKVATRLEVYENATKPVLDYYKSKGVCRVIDGNRGTEDVYQDLHTAIEHLTGGASRTSRSVEQPQV